MFRKTKGIGQILISICTTVFSLQTEKTTKKTGIAWHGTKLYCSKKHQYPEGSSMEVFFSVNPPPPPLSDSIKNSINLPSGVSMVIIWNCILAFFLVLRSAHSSVSCFCFCLFVICINLLHPCLISFL